MNLLTSSEVAIVCVILLGFLIYEYLVNIKGMIYKNRLIAVLISSIIFTIISSLYNSFSLKVIAFPSETFLFYYNFLYNLAALLLVYSWAAFSRKVINGKDKWVVKLLMINGAIASIVTIFYLAYPNHDMFQVLNSDGTVTFNDFDYFWYVIEYIPILICLIQSIRAYMKSSNYAHRERYLPMIVYSLMFASSGIILLFDETSNAIHIGLALSMSYLYINTIKSEVTHDGLTNLNNRRKFLLDLDERMKSNDKRTLYLMMIDINGFKKINDEYGHIVGDDLLADFSKQLERSCQGSNARPYRYGGDEFAVLINCDSTSGVEDYCSLLASKVKDMTKYSKFEKQITFSYGYVKYDDSIKDISIFVDKADEKLYEMKDSLQRNA